MDDVERQISMTKILFFVSEDWYFVSHRLKLAVAAREQGYDVTIMTRVKDHEKTITDAGLKLISLQHYSRSLNPLKAINSIFEIINCYKKEKPDIIHQVALKPIVFGTIASWATKKTKIIQAITGLGQGFTKPKTAKILKALLSLTLGGKNKIVLFQNQDDKKDLIKIGALKENARTSLIRGAGIDLKKYRLLSAPSTENTRVALVARMLRHKGVIEFAEAARILQGKGIEMVLVGAPDPGAPSSISSEMLESWADEGILTYYGYTDDTREIWKACDIAALPSYSEGLPKSLLEAAACGRPMIASDVTGNRDICRDGLTGILVPVKDAKALANAIEVLAKDMKSQIKYGHAARKLVEEEFSLKRVIRETLELYEEILNS